LLHRPVLVKFISASRSDNRDSQELKFLQEFGMNNIEICTKSAMEIIDIVLKIVSEPGLRQTLLGAWWFSLYYSGCSINTFTTYRNLTKLFLAFNAALVIVGVVWVYREGGLSASPMTGQANEAAQYPSRAVLALSKLDDGNRLIDKCRCYLEQLSSILVHPGMSLFYHGCSAIIDNSRNSNHDAPFGIFSTFL
jgi:hypothetical protein